MSTNLRTIWLTLRATNYTTAVFTNVITNMKGLDAAQKQAINSSLNLGKSAFAAGMLFNVLGSQMGGAAGQALTYASYVMYIVSSLSYLKAGILVVTAFMENHALIVNIVSSSYFKLGVAMAGIIGAVMLFLALKDTLGLIPALLIAIGVAAAAIAIPLWLAATAEAGVTGGASAWAAVPAVAALKGVAAFTGFQHGTRMAEFTGPAMLHRGEVIFNPATGRPTQIANDLAGGKGGSTMIDASMHVDTVNTKMDTEEMNKLLKKQGRTIAQNNR